MDRDEERRREFEEFYESLSPEERRGRIYLNPVFTVPYNRISQANRTFPIPSYLWERWVPVLGVLAVAVYVELRRMTFVNDATGERRTIVWPKQETLAKRLGLKDRHSIATALRVLEEHGFIERWRTTYNDQGTGRLRRGVTAYDVKWEFPLVAADAVELLIEQVTPTQTDQNHHRVENLPYGICPVDNSHRRVEKLPPTRVEKLPCETLPRTITSNVTNVESRTSRKSSLRQRPEVQALNAEERASREGLALEIGESLKTWSGSWDGEAHQSEGFHRRVALLMPEHLVRQALAATQDAVARKRDGQGGCHQGPAAYFAGVAKKLAAEAGIDLGLKAQERPEGPIPAAQRPQEARKAPSPPPEPEEPPISMQEAKRRFRELKERLAAERR